MTSDGQVLSLLVPPPPPSWDASKDLAIHAKVSTFMTVALEPVGKAFQTRAKSLASKRTLTEEMEMEQALLDAEGDLDAGEEDEVESAKLLRSDPGKWKDQDHYAVLGLSKKRHGASEDDIKRACKISCVIWYKKWELISLCKHCRPPKGLETSP